MTPEEIADDLILQFQMHCEIHGSKPGEANYDGSVLRGHAKSCAIICVDYLINNCGRGYDLLVDSDPGLKEARDKMGGETVVQFYTKVKEAIQSL